jgi:hypothetical protein
MEGRQRATEQALYLHVLVGLVWPQLRE